MREIKFRGRRKNSSEWVYGFFLAIPKLCSYIYDVQPDGQATRYLVDEDTVGQFTGKKDVNKKKIFEDDVVYFLDDRAHERIGVIKWHEKMCCWMIDCGEAGRDMLANYACEIRGNIHNNPELLEAHA